MMNKLLKYECIAVGRILVPIWVGTAVLSLLVAVTERMNQSFDSLVGTPVIAMVACGQGVAILPQLILQRYQSSAGEFQVLRLEPSASRSIGIACLDKNGLSPAARQFWRRVRTYAAQLP